MASKETIIEILYLGFMDYVPKTRLLNYRTEYTNRKSHNTKFALHFFPKYIDFEKAIKKPITSYDTLLLNYWIIEVPNIGLRGSKLFWDYRYGKNSLINKRLKSQEKKQKPRTKLLLTKKQKEERKRNITEL